MSQRSRTRLRDRERQRSAFGHAHVVDGEARCRIVLGDRADALVVGDRRAIRGAAQIDVEVLVALVHRVVRRRDADSLSSLGARECQRSRDGRIVAARSRRAIRRRVVDRMTQLG